MTARTDFAIAHLGGTLAGVVAGGTLPWWASGSVAWAMAGLLLAALFAIRAPATVAKPIVLGAWWGGEVRFTFKRDDDGRERMYKPIACPGWSSLIQPETGAAS